MVTFSIGWALGVAEPARGLRRLRGGLQMAVSACPHEVLLQAALLGRLTRILTSFGIDIG